MSLTTSAKGGASIAPLEPGTYPAICYGLIDIGVQYNETYKNSSPKIIIMWEIPGETITIEGEEKPRVMSQTYTSSLNERAALRRDLALWRGRDFTEAELASFDLKTIVGVPCLLTVVQREYNGRTYANIGGVTKMAKGMERPKGTLEKVIFDLDTDPGTLTTFLSNLMVLPLKRQKAHSYLLYYNAQEKSRLRCGHTLYPRFQPWSSPSLKQ